MKNSIFLKPYKLILLSFFISIFSINLTFSQDNSSNYDINQLMENLPKAPEAASLGQYGDIANNPYTGKANVSVSIHTINFEGLQIPIQLSYDTGGVRVASEAGWVGLNWSLSTHVGVTRTINGNDDLNLNRIPNASGASTAFPFHDDIPVIDSYPYMNLGDVIDIHTSFGGSGAFYKPRSYTDTQPDIFEVSIFGKSYTFRFKKRIGTSNIIETHIFNSNHAVITYNLTERSFTLINENGFEFYFSTKEYATSFTSSGSLNNSSSVIREHTLTGTLDDPFGQDRGSTTSWLLDEITSPLGKELNFTYKPGIYISQPVYSGSVEVNETALVTSLDPYLPNNFVSQPTYSSTIDIIETNYLETITSDFGSITFLSDQRKDLMTGNDFFAEYGFNPNYFIGYHNGVLDGSGSSRNFSYRHGTSEENLFTYTTYKLNEILVKDYNNAVVKEVDLYTSYFNNDEEGQTDEAEYLRLKLDSLTVNEKKYKFDYEQPNSLPSKLTDDIDFWGFYNGANNTTNVPSIGRFVTGYTGLGANGLPDNQNAHSYFNFNGASRKSDFNHGKKGILNKITYPTGGYTSLNYSPHKVVTQVTKPYFFTDYFSNGRPKWTNLKDEDLYNFTYLYLKNANDPSFDYYDNVIDPNIDTSGSGTSIGISFETQTPAVVRIRAPLYLVNGDACSNGWEGYPAYVIQDLHDENTYYTVFTYDDFSSNPSADPVTRDVFVPPGEYIMKFMSHFPPPGSCSLLAVFNGSVQRTLFDGNTENYLEAFEVGGTRIANIANYNNDNSFISKKVYDYNLPNVTDLSYASSGKLMDDLTFFSKTFGYYSYSPRYGTFGGSVTLSSNSTIRQSASAQGSHIGYTSVTEKSVNSVGDDLGKIERTYQNVKNLYYKESFNRYFRSDHNPANLIYVDIENTLLTGMSPKVDFGHSNGNVLSERIYNKSGGMVRLTVNDYSPLNLNPDNNYYANFQGAMYTTTGEVDPYFANAETFSVYQLNTNLSKKSVLMSSHVVDYFPNGSQSYTDQYNTYNTVSGEMLATNTEIRDNEALISKYYYPYSDEVSGLPYMNQLINNNQYQNIIKTENYRNADKLNEKLTSFSSFNNNILPSKIEASKANEELVEKIAYQRYDDDGNILQVQQGANGLVTSYIWGYNKQYIVAKVENASYAQIENLADFGSNFTIPNALSSSQIQQLKSLSGTVLTSYEHKPLVGLISMTDPRGYTQSFEYDEFNRFERVRDQENNIVTEYEYNLNNETIEPSIGIIPQGQANDDEIVIGRSTMQFNNDSYDSLSSSISLTETQGNGSSFTFDYKMNSNGGTGNYSYRWKRRGESFSDYSSTNTFTVSFDCNVEDVRGLEIICEVKDNTLGVTHRSIMKHIVYCNN